MIMATCCGLFTLNCVVSAQNWTLKSAPATYLSSVASSADGSKLVAAGGNVGLFLSTNSGSTWTNSFGGDWTRVASSADGAKLVAVTMGDVVTSTDSGATWQHDYPVEPERVWSAVASSADGTKLVVAAYNGGPLYASANSGTSWVQLTNYPVANQWILAIASSADGRTLATASKKLVPFGQGGVYISTNSGQTWVQVTNLPNDDWDAIALSADGTKMVAAPQNDSIYISTNTGATWSPTETPSELWESVAMSADGTKVIAGPAAVIYTSVDSGITWTTNNVPFVNCVSVASSADGNELEAVDSSVVGIWISQTTPAPCLNITPTNNNLTLSWVSPSTNFVLQQSSDLTTTNWVTLTNIPTLNLSNLQDEATLSPSNNSSFYRLATPSF